MDELKGRIFELLSQHGQRATYSAVAGFLGTEARTLMQGAPRTKLYSWVVNAKTGLPTGYRIEDLDPRLLDSDYVIKSPLELGVWVQAHTVTKVNMKNKLSVTINGSSVQIGPFTFSIERTLRLPNDGKKYPLPPSLGSFPLHKVDDYKDKVPAAWREHGGVFFPMWQREAAWLSFHGEYENPAAVRVAAGKVCAVTGKVWEDGLTKDPQNYMVVGGPDSQPWLDGFKTGEGVISQFVAMPLGQGYTVEKQITGEEKHGGLQIAAFACKPDRRPIRPIPAQQVRRAYTKGGVSGQSLGGGGVYACSSGPIGSSGSLRAFNVGPAEAAESMDFMEEMRSTKGAEMGLAAGGLMQQAIHKDSLGFECWDVETGGRIFVHIVNSQMYEAITGRKAPKSPISAKSYTDQGYPWFSTYEEDQGKDVAVQPNLVGLKNVAQIDKEKGIEGQQDDSSFEVPKQKIVEIKDPNAIRDGNW